MITEVVEKIIKLKWTPDAGFPVPPNEAIKESLTVENQEEVIKRAHYWLDIYERREKAIKLAKEEPLKYGLEWDCWKDADELLKDCSLLAVFGGNRAAKSEYAAKRMVETLIEYPGTSAIGACQKLQTSGLQMQKYIWKFIPPEIKALNHVVDKRGVFRVSYSEADGFTKNVLVLPNTSKILFVGYSQETKDYEGMQFGHPDHEVLAAWAEEDMPLGWLKLLRFRTSNYAGKIVWTFTAVDGLTKTMQDVLKGVEVVKSLPAKELDQDTQLLPDCPKGHAPYIVKTFTDRDRAIYFFTEFNPYSNYENVRKQCEGRPTFDWERRLYGFARAARGRLIPNFGPSHIIHDDKMFWDMPGTNVMVVDPAPRKNWFMLWGRVLQFEVPRIYIYREWPSLAEFGEWHVTSEGHKADGDPGPAQYPLGYGYVEYKRVLRQKEIEPIYSRIIDPRAGSEHKASDFGQTSVIEQMAAVHRDANGQVIGKSYDFWPAIGLEESTGLTQINDMLAFDQSKPLDWMMNFPNLVISHKCGNLIAALETYTGQDGLKAACKDPVDCLRYMVTYGYEHVDPDEPLVYGGFTY